MIMGMNVNKPAKYPDSAMPSGIDAETSASPAVVAEASQALTVDPAIERAVKDIHQRLDNLPDSKKEVAVGLATASMLERLAEMNRDFAIGVHLQALSNLGVEVKEYELQD